MDALQSPTDRSGHLEASQEQPNAFGQLDDGNLDDHQVEEAEDELPDEDYIKVKVYLFNKDKAFRNKVFTEEWFMVAADHTEGEDELDKDGIPFLEVRSSSTSMLLSDSRCEYSLKSWTTRPLVRCS